MDNRGRVFFAMTDYCTRIPFFCYGCLYIPEVKNICGSLHKPEYLIEWYGAISYHLGTHVHPLLIGIEEGKIGEILVVDMPMNDPSVKWSHQLLRIMDKEERDTVIIHEEAMRHVRVIDIMIPFKVEDSPIQAF